MHENRAFQDGHDDAAIAYFQIDDVSEGASLNGLSKRSCWSIDDRIGGSCDIVARIKEDLQRSSEGGRSNVESVIPWGKGGIECD